MATYSNIEWTESTWNPITGCTKISIGCKNCYAERMSRRLKAMGQRNYLKGFQLSFHEEMLLLPLSWKKPQTIFVNSMSDLFHKDVSIDFILKVFNTMNSAPWHRYQILTKRSMRLHQLNDLLEWGDHIWLGVTVENDDLKYRIEHLRMAKAKIKFVSFEPLLGPIGNVNLEGIDWAIVGGESGPGARPMNPEWVVSIRDQCLKSSVRFFFKQWGGFNKKKNGRLLEGRTWDEMPVSAYA